MSKSLVGAVLLALLIGGGVGFVAGVQYGAPDDSAIGDGASTSGDSGSAGQSGGDGATVAPRRSESPTVRAPVATGEMRAAETANAVETFVRSYRPPPLRPGNGVVHGMVRTAEGVPIPGATVVFTLESRKPREIEKRLDEAGRPRFPSAEEEAQKALERHIDSAASRFESSSGQDGRYRLEGLPDSGRGTLAFYKPGFVFGEHLMASDAWIEIGATFDVIGRPAHRVAFDVIGADGAPLDEARLNLEFGGTGWSMTDEVHWQRSDPAIEMGGGVFTAWACPMDEDLFVSDKVRTEVPSDISTGRPVVLRIRPRVVIKGRILFPDGQTPSDYEIGMATLGKGQPALTNEQFLAAEKVDGYQWRARGAYRFEDLAEGTYQIGVTLGHLVVLGMAVVEVKDRPVDCDIKCEAIRTDDYIVVKTVGAQNQPLIDTRIVEPWQRSFMILPGIYHVVKKEHFRPSQKISDDEETKLKIVVESQQLGTKSVEIDPRKDAEVTMKFEAAARIHVKVPGVSVHPLSPRFKIEVTAEKSDTPLFFDESTKARKDDVWTFDRIQPGNYRVTLVTIDAGRSQCVLAATDVTVGGTDVDATLIIPPIGSLTVTTDPSIKLNDVSLVPLGDQSIVGFPHGIAKNGAFEFDIVAGGTYEVQVSASVELASVVVSIPAVDKVHVADRPANGIEIAPSMTRSAKELQSGLRIGDVVVGTADVEWTKNPTRAFSEAIGAASDSVGLRVVRSGALIDVTLDPKKVRADLGQMRLRPVAR